MARARRQQQAPRRRRVENKRLVSPTIDYDNLPTQFKFPTQNELVDLSDGELLGLLQRWGMVDTVEQRKVRAAEHVAKISQMRDKKLTKTQLRTSVQAAMRRDLLGDNRKMMREFTTLEAAAGTDLETQQFVRMGENDEGTCEGCDPLIGQEGTLAYHASIGMPGPASCFGGDYCRCTLVLLD